MGSGEYVVEEVIDFVLEERVVYFDFDKVSICFDVIVIL